MTMPSFPFLVLFLLLVLLFKRDACPRLQLFQAKRVIPQSLHSCLLLLHNSKKRIFANFGSNVTSGVGVLNRNEVLVRGTELRDP
jgi:hypothetical protein